MPFEACFDLLEGSAKLVEHGADPHLFWRRCGRWRTHGLRRLAGSLRLALRGSLHLGWRRFLDRPLFLRGYVSLRLLLLRDRRRLGVSLSRRGRRRGESDKTDQAGKIFQQNFSRMTRGVAKHSGQTKRMAKSQRIMSCFSD
jgi:hypothetical protein